MPTNAQIFNALMDMQKQNGVMLGHQEAILKEMENGRKKMGEHTDKISAIERSRAYNKGMIVSVSTLVSAATIFIAKKLGLG